MRALTLLLALLAPAQNAPTPTDASGTGVPEQVRVEDLPPQVRLGLRVESVRRHWRVIPDVVLVEDESQYVEAVARWRFPLCYPVLIDDGSFDAREQIGRFVRAFGPRRVVRWSTDEARMPDEKEVPRFVESAMARAWTLPDERSTQDDLMKAWASVGLVPQGVIVADADDPAWTAAIALGTFRAEPVLWGEVPDRGMRRADADSLAAIIRDAAKATGLSWNRLGDQLDAVTLTANAPPAVVMKNQPRETIATTDYLGRLEGVDAPGPRWAWTGQVDGSARDAAYRAMCAVFCRPTRAWLFDGYADDGVWAAYDATEAGVTLARAGYTTEVHDLPDNSLDHWRAAVCTGIDAGLAFVNTSGMRDWFDLHPGRGRSGDVPLLDLPAAVYFVHSWSANDPTLDATIAGRWMRNGAYAYCGSVQEPYLQGFVPTPAVAARLVSASPWGAAVRFEKADPWRVATLGDPLITLGEPLTRVEDPLPLKDAEDLAEAMRAAAKAGKLDEAARLLVLLGRDGDAVRLGEGVLGDDETKLTPELAEAVLMPLFRAGRRGAFLAAYRALPSAEVGDLTRRDALWAIGRPELRVTRDASLLGLFRANLRPGQEPSDAEELAGSWSRVFDHAAALSMLEQVKATLSNKQQLREMDAVIGRFKKRR